MTIENFKKFIESWIHCRDKATEIYNVGVDIYEILDPYWGIINPLMGEIFTEEQSELLDNYIYNDGEKVKTIEELYKEIYVH